MSKFDCGQKITINNFHDPNYVIKRCQNYDKALFKKKQKQNP